MLSCVHTQTLLQHYFSQFPNSPLSCALNHPLVFFVFPCFPVGPLSLSLSPPPCFTALSLTHTLFPFQQSVPVQILSDFLSAAQHFSAAFFHCSPCSAPPACSFLVAAAGGAIELYFPGRKSPQFYMHVVATVRFTELKISREEFIAPGEWG